MRLLAVIAMCLLFVGYGEPLPPDECTTDSECEVLS